MLGLFQKFMTKYDEVMNWVRVITLNQFTKNYQKEEMIWEKKQRRDKYKGDFQVGSCTYFTKLSCIFFKFCINLNLVHIMIFYERILISLS